ncbi:MAG: NTP transferase domain-containing protein [Anaerolineales bacterium]|nr:NTP transferase domain-containing protein [Anaerolineales bacterium]
MEAIITAGGVSASDDPLYAHTGVSKKALIPLSGQPMIGWVIQALLGTGLIDHLVIVGLNQAELNFNHPALYFMPAAGGLLDNVLAGVDQVRAINPAAQKVLLCSSDIPLITPEIVHGYLAECGSQDAEIYYAIVEEKTMEARFPGSKRTFVPFKGGRYSGGDIFLLDLAAQANVELFRSLIGSRKNYLAQARMLGLAFIIRFLLRSMTVEEAAERARERMKLNARVVVTRFAELGMDLDKAHQYDLIKAELEKINLSQTAFRP